MQQEAFLLFIQKRMMTLSINHTYLRQHRTIRPLTSKSNSLLSIIENNAAPNTDVYRAITFMESPDANCY